MVEMCDVAELRYVSIESDIEQHVICRETRPQGACRLKRRWLCFLTAVALGSGSLASGRLQEALRVQSIGNCGLDEESSALVRNQSDSVAVEMPEEVAWHFVPQANALFDKNRTCFFTWQGMASIAGFKVAFENRIAWYFYGDWTARDAMASREGTYEYGRWSLSGPFGGRWFNCLKRLSASQIDEIYTNGSIPARSTS